MATDDDDDDNCTKSEGKSSSKNLICIDYEEKIIFTLLHAGI
jgi:hypothetical protein